MLSVRIPSIRPSLTSLGSRLRRNAPYSVLAFGSASIPSFDAFDSSFLGYFVRVSFRSRISNEWISGCGTIPDRLIGIVVRKPSIDLVSIFRSLSCL